MALVVLTVGVPRDPLLRDQVERYRRRTPVPFQWEWEHVPEGGGRRGAGGLTGRLKPADRVVALDPAGELVDSESLARRVSSWLDGGGRTVLVIGGAEGLPREVKDRADWQWSLSPLTFPHEMALVLVAEQLYRAWAISHGHPYHK